MRIAVLGVGSIGGVVLGALSDTDADLVAVSRGQAASNLEMIGLILHTPEGSIEMIPPDRFSVVDSQEGPIPEQIRGTCDVAIICGKASSTSVLAQIAEEVLTPNGLAISIQNGLGHSEMLAHRLGRERVLGGSITHGAWKDGETGVHWVGRGAIRMGNLDGGDCAEVALALMQVFEDANLNPMWSDDVQNIVWRKLLLNVAINPVCAIAGVRNGALIDVPELWDQAMAAMLEAAAVGRASGVDLGDVDLEEVVQRPFATEEGRAAYVAFLKTDALFADLESVSAVFMPEPFEARVIEEGTGAGTSGGTSGGTTEGTSGGTSSINPFGDVDNSNPDLYSSGWHCHNR